MGNEPNISRDSFDFTKWRDTVLQQQGVPISDSDMNEQASILLMQQILSLRTLYGNILLPPEAGASQGFQAQAIAGQVQNLLFSAGYALVGGALVPSTRAVIPQDVNYEDDANYLTQGVFTAIAATNFIDTNKKFEAWLDLVGCRVKMTSGADSGNTGTISSVVNLTTLGMTPGDLMSVVPGDTYIIKPPIIPIVTAPTAFDFQLWVWWEYINENLDSDIVNPDLGIETSQRLVRRWVIRTSGSAAPSGSADSFDLRGMSLATATISPTDTQIDPDIPEDDFADPTLAWTKPFAETTLIDGVVSGAAEIVLPEDSYFVGTGSLSNALSYFQLYDGNDVSRLKPLVGSDVGPVYASSLVLSGSPVNPAADADANGFVTGVLTVSFDMSKTTDSILTTNVTVKCAVKRTLLDMATVPAWGPESMIMRSLPARDVWATDSALATNAVNGSKTALLSGGRIQDILTALLTEIRERPTTDCPSEAYGVPGWKYLLETGDPAHSAGQSRLYWNPATNELFWLRGGTLSGTSRDITATSTSISVSGLIGSSAPPNAIEAYKTGTTPTSTYDLDLVSTWTHYRITNDSGEEAIICPKVTFTSTVVAGLLAQMLGLVEFSHSTLFTSTFTGMQDERLPRVATGNRILLYEASNYDTPATVDGCVRIYLYTLSTLEHHMCLEIVTGAYWDDSAQKWTLESWSGGSVNRASYFSVRGDGSFVFAAHRSTSTWNHDEETGGWDNWQTQNMIVGDEWSIPEVRGVAQFRQQFALQATLEGAAQAYSDSQGVTWPVICTDIAESGSALTFTIDHESGWDTSGTASVNVAYVDEYGCIIYGLSESIADTVQTEVHLWGHLNVESVRD